MVNFATPLTTLDPAWGCKIEDFARSNNSYSKLVSYGTAGGPNGTEQVDPEEIVPDVTTEWNVSEDGLTYTFTFTVDDGITFPSGEHLDAEAVKYSFERTMNINCCGSTTIKDLFNDPNLIESLGVLDATTVGISLTVVDPNFLQGLAPTPGAIYDRSVIENHGGGDTRGEPNEFLATDLVGNGLYVLENYSVRSSAVLTTNPNYHGKAPMAQRSSLQPNG